MMGCEVSPSYLLDRMHDKLVEDRWDHCFPNHRVRFSLTAVVAARVNISVDLPTLLMSVDSMASTLMSSEAYNSDRIARKLFANLPKHSNRMDDDDDDLSYEQIEHRTLALLSD